MVQKLFKICSTRCSTEYSENCSKICSNMFTRLKKSATCSKHGSTKCSKKCSKKYSGNCSKKYSGNCSEKLTDLPPENGPTHGSKHCKSYPIKKHEISK